MIDKDRLLWLIRLNVGDSVLLFDNETVELTKVSTIDVMHNRMWFSNGKSVRCNNGFDKHRRIEPVKETSPFNENKADDYSWAIKLADEYHNEKIKQSIDDEQYEIELRKLKRTHNKCVNCTDGIDGETDGSGTTFAGICHVCDGSGWI